MTRHQLKSYGMNNFELPKGVIDKLGNVEEFPLPTNPDEVDRYFLRVAYELSSIYSDDPIAQNGAVLIKPSPQPSLKDVIVWGVNHMHQGYEDVADILTKVDDKNWKNLRITHAERDTVYAASRKGLPLG